MKFGVCAIIKNENLYLREWVEYYINLGFDKIILYDNNEIDGEIPNVVIQDYIDSGIIDIYTDTRGKSGILNKRKFHGNIQKESYNRCLQEYRDSLDWILFVDIDEFLYLEKYKKIQYLFENEKVYENFDAILINWKLVKNTDLYYKNKPVKQENTETSEHIEWAGGNMNCQFKSFVSTKKLDVYFKYNIHKPDFAKLCNVYGKECSDMDGNIFMLTFYNHYTMYIEHYYTKSLTEFLYRSLNALYDLQNRILAYKTLNGWSEEHERIYQKFLKDNNIEASK